MVDRQEVEALVREIEEGCREHSCTPHDMSLDVEGDTLLALCRAWLALEAAREDAERYRWLRQMIYDERIITAPDNQAAMLYGDKLDAAVDSAREARNG